MPLTGIAAAGISALGGLLTNAYSGSYNSSEAAKNRQFQLDMYNRQYSDTLDFWNLQNAYNDPSAQVARMRKAGINPLLYYSNGQVQNVNTQAPQTPSAPGGSQARASFVNPLQTAEYLLIDAQRNKLEKESQKIESETNWQNLELKYAQDTYGVRMAIQHKNFEFLEVEMEKMRNDIFNQSRLTSEQVQTYIQGRLYEIKRFNLDSDTQGAYIAQGWKSLTNDTARVNQGWRQLALDAIRVTNETNMTNAQVGMLQWQLLQDKAMFLPRFQGLSLDNKLKIWDTHLRKANLTEKQVNIWNGVLKNYYLYNYGDEKWTGKNPLGFKLGEHLRPQFQDIFVLPWKR